MKTTIVRATVLGATLLSGCGSDAEKPPAKAAAAAEATLEVPADGDAFLRALWPLPAPEIAVVYDVTGPAGMTGSLELLVRQGGFRRENWLLELPGDGAGPVAVRGTTIMTPSAMWSGVLDEPGQRMDLPVHKLGQAYDALEADKRRQAADSLQRWRDQLERARADNPGETREVAGQRCLWTRVAAQTLCMWEETGLALRYEGPAFSLEAVRIDRSPTLASDAFALPASFGAAAVVAPPHNLDFDPNTALQALIGGDPAVLALGLSPGFRPPLPAAP